METLSGIPESALDQVIDDLKFDGLKLVSKFKAADGTWTVIAAPANGSGTARTTDGHTRNLSEILPKQPPVPAMDRPEPPPAGATSRFVFARSTMPRTVSYIDDAGREEIREGGSRSWRNCNPGNIRKGDFSISCGAIGDDGSFAIFPDEDTGSQAIVSLLKSKSYIELSLRDAVFRYAPPSENDSTAYLNALSKGTGIAPDTTLRALSAQDFRKVAAFIKKIEGWKPGFVSDGSPHSPLLSETSGVGTTAASATNGWMDIARREAALPVRERSSWSDPEENPRILNYFKVCAAWFENIEGDETDWCAAFVNYCLVTSGHPGTDHPGARSFFWNKKGSFAVLPGPVVGAIGVRRYAPFTDPKWTTGQGHVGFVTQFNDTTVTLLGGNQDNTVREKTFPLRDADANGDLKSEFVAFLMPAIN